MLERVHGLVAQRQFEKTAEMKDEHGEGEAEQPQRGRGQGEQRP